MTGTEVIRRVRSNPVTQHAYSVILTARTEAEIRDFNLGAKEVGVDEFIQEPLLPDVVHSLLSKLNRQGLASNAHLEHPQLGHS